MKTKAIFFIVVGLVFDFVIAQDQLKVEYELTEPEENFRTPDLPAGIEIKVPKRYFELILNKEESIWKSIEKVNNEQNEDKGMVARISFPPSGDLYKNLKDKIKVKEEESYSKDYLIKDSLNYVNWKISKESKEILEVSVQKATFLDEEKGIELIAWYAPKLNFKNGPDEYWGLPGLILELELITHADDNSKYSHFFIATKVEVLKSNNKIKQPNKGIVVTQEEFNQINEDNFQKMMEMSEQGVDKD